MKTIKIDLVIHYIIQVPDDDVSCVAAPWPKLKDGSQWYPFDEPSPVKGTQSDVYEYHGADIDNVSVDDCYCPDAFFCADGIITCECGACAICQDDPDYENEG